MIKTATYRKQQWQRKPETLTCFGPTACPGFLSHVKVSGAVEEAFGSSSGSFQKGAHFYVYPGQPSKPVSLLRFTPKQEEATKWAQEQLGLKQDTGQARGPGGRDADLNVQVKLLPRSQPLIDTLSHQGGKNRLW